ncbi:glycosyltransferase [Patescibacteria group bacterium]|nr:glycosyltransferase [Patescibacteria group bacterium]
MTPKVSIIIPVKKINDYLRQETIPAILKQTYKNFEIIILPDKKTKERFPQTRIIPTYPKTGPADKRDIGARKAKGEILAFLDDDSYPDKNWLKNAVKIFTSHQPPATSHQPIAAVCGPSLTPPHNNLRQKASGYVWSTWLGSSGAGTYRCAIYPRKEIDDYPTVNFLVRKRDFVKVGGFDSHFWPGEDTRLCLLLTKKLKKKIIYDPKVLVYHHRREVFGPHLKQISRYAIHRGHFARILPETSFRIGYFMPTIFVLGLFGGPLLIFVLEIFQLCIISIPLFLLYLFSVFVYLLLLLITVAEVYLKERNLRLALLIVPSIFVTHLVYGVLFIKGFFSPKLRQ